MVTVIIPVYQVSDYVERCICSVMEQTYTDIECIIVDDATKDDSIEKCERLIAEYNDYFNVNLDLNHNVRSSIKFKILHHEVNRGLSAARNTGIDAASGEYVYFLDGDDEITSDCIETLVSHVINDNTVEMVQGSFVKDFGDKTIKYQYNDSRITGNDEARSQFLYNRNINYAVWNKLLKRTFVLENRLYNKDGILCEDLLWTFYLIKYLKSAWLCKDITYHYKLRPGSIVTGKNKAEKGKSEVIVYEEILHNLTEGKERDELYGFLYNFSEVLANYLRCTPELKRIQREYKHLAWQYGCWYVCMVLTVVAVISRFGNPMGILKKMNALRWILKGKVIHI